MLRGSNHEKYFDDLQGRFSASYIESVQSPLQTVHVHDAFEMTLVLSDNVSVEVNEEMYDLPGGTLLLFNTMDLHRIYARDTTGYRRFVLWFKYDFLAELEPVREELLKCFYNRAFEKSNILKLSEEQLYEVEALYKRIEAVHKKQGGSRKTHSLSEQLLIKLMLGELLFIVNGIYQEQHSVEDTTVTGNQQMVYKVIRYIQEHLSDKLDRYELARMAYMDIRKLNNYFRDITGMTIGRYILNCRLTVAKAYLAQGITVTQVCEKAGFGDCCNFSRTFHKHVGMSPKQYAEQYK